MARQIQSRRGTTAQHASFTGAAGEVTVDTDKKVPVVHDNSTAGGFPVARDDLAMHLAGAETVTGKKSFTTTQKIQQVLEKVTITADNPAATTHFDVLTQAIQYYTTANDTNWTLNVRGDGSTSLDSLMAVGESLTIALKVTNTGTAYRHTALTIDGNSVTPQWLGAAAPSAGTINKRDNYTFNIVKIGSATFIVDASFAAGN